MFSRWFKTKNKNKKTTFWKLKIKLKNPPKTKTKKQQTHLKMFLVADEEAVVVNKSDKGREF